MRTTPATPLVKTFIDVQLMQPGRRSVPPSDGQGSRILFFFADLNH